MRHCCSRIARDFLIFFPLERRRPAAMQVRGRFATFTFLLVLIPGINTRSSFFFVLIVSVLCLTGRIQKLCLLAGLPIPHSYQRRARVGQTCLCTVPQMPRTSVHVSIVNHQPSFKLSRYRIEIMEHDFRCDNQTKYWTHVCARRPFLRRRAANKPVTNPTSLHHFGGKYVVRTIALAMMRSVGLTRRSQRCGRA